MGMYIDEVKKNLLALSEEKENFHKAVNEWKFIDSYLFKENNPDAFWPDDATSCALCFQWPINEVCLIENSKNENQLHIGNECVKKFLGDEIERQHRETIKQRKDTASYKKNKILFEKSDEFKELEILSGILSYGRRKDKLIAIKERVQIKGGPTKKQYASIHDIFQGWFGDAWKDILEYHTISKKTTNPRDKEFLNSLVRQKKSKQQLSPKQTAWFNGIKGRI